MCIGSGIQLEEHRPALVRDTRAKVIQLEKVNDHWAHNLPLVGSILDRFYRYARNRPAKLWSHTICWTDQAINAFFSRREETADGNPPEECPFGKDVVLRFEPKARRHVMVPNNDHNYLRWVRPGKREDAKDSLLKFSHYRRYTDAARRFVNFSQRETLGAATPGWQDDPLVANGQLPGQRGLVYGLGQDHTGTAKLLRMPLAPREKIIDPSGIVDVSLLKGLRLFQPPTLEDDVMVDGLVFAFDSQGLIVYIVASSERYEGSADESVWGKHEHEWVERNVPRGKSR
jgi:hypothetical protein